MSGGPKVVTMKRCFRSPIPALFDVARYLDAAVSAHHAGYAMDAARLFTLADCQLSRQWLESIWGRASPYVAVTKLPPLPITMPVKARMPTNAQIRSLHARDGFHCRFWGLPVIRAEIRKKAVALYPEAVSWGRTNASQHAGFQALWAQYDHVVPHSAGGTNELDNLIVTCAACNFGKMSYRLEEIGLLDPREFPIVVSHWDGLERFEAFPDHKFELNGDSY